MDQEIAAGSARLQVMGTTAEFGRKAVDQLGVMVDAINLMEERMAEYRQEAAKLLKVADFCEMSVPDAIRTAVTGKGAKATANAPRATCSQCGATAKNANGLLIHASRAHGKAS